MSTCEGAGGTESNASSSTENRDIEVGRVYEATIEKLVYGGDGLARIGTHAVFVPLAAPGDRASVRIVHLARNYARAEIEKIIVPSPFRRDPPCPHFGDCGGCQLQHIAYPAQIAAKREFLRESLHRIAKIEYEEEIEVITAAEFEYRSRAEVKVSRIGDSDARIGFYRIGSHDVCEVKSCPILLPAANRELGRLHDEKELLPKDATRVYITAGDDGVLVTPGTGDGARQAQYDALGTARQRIAGVDYEFGVRSFFQVNRLLVEKLVNAAIADRRGRLALDLYAGVGLFTLQLARRFDQVYSVEGNHIAASHGVRNLRTNGIANVRYEATSVEAWLKNRAPQTGRPDFVLLDPPRAGAGAVTIERIAAIAPDSIGYVSCDPATLARDLKILLDRGYFLRSLTVLDMFPQTFHLETVAHFEKRKTGR